eukprot:8771308-Pyramimonas_sp.AAC.1
MAHVRSQHDDRSLCRVLTPCNTCICGREFFWDRACAARHLVLAVQRGHCRFGGGRAQRPLTPPSTLQRPLCEFEASDLDSLCRRLRSHLPGPVPPRKRRRLADAPSAALGNVPGGGGELDAGAFGDSGTRGRWGPWLGAASQAGRRGQQEEGEGRPAGCA